MLFNYRAALACIFTARESLTAHLMGWYDANRHWNDLTTLRLNSPMQRMQIAASDFLCIERFRNVSCTSRCIAMRFSHALHTPAMPGLSQCIILYYIIRMYSYVIFFRVFFVCPCVINRFHITFLCKYVCVGWLVTECIVVMRYVVYNILCKGNVVKMESSKCFYYSCRFAVALCYNDSVSHIMNYSKVSQCSLALVLYF